MEDLLAIHLPLIRAMELGLGAVDLQTEHRLKQTAADTLELSTPAGTLFDGPWVQSIRRPDRGLARGSVIHLRDFSATVLDDDQGRPTRVAFRFDRPLEDPSLVLLAVVDGKLKRYALPAMGQEVVLPRGRVLATGP